MNVGIIGLLSTALLLSGVDRVLITEAAKHRPIVNAGGVIR